MTPEVRLEVTSALTEVESISGAEKTEPWAQGETLPQRNRQRVNEDHTPCPLLGPYVHTVCTLTHMCALYSLTQTHINKSSYLGAGMIEVCNTHI